MEPLNIPEQPDKDNSDAPATPGTAGQVFGPAAPADNPPERPLAVASSVPAVNPQPVFSGDAPKKTRLKLPKKTVILVFAVLVLLGGGAAAYFGYYAPNKPNSIWSASLHRTSQAYDKLVAYTDSQAQANYKGMALSGSFKASGSFAADGSFQGKSDGGNGELTGNFSAGGVKTTLDIRTLKSTGTAPDIYLKLDGLQGLGDLLGGSGSPYSSVINGINGSWYFIDHSLIDQYTQSSADNLQVSPGDIKSLLNDIGGPTKTYILTDNPTNSALKLKQTVGKEKIDGRETYHYKVGINKANLKKYNNALCDSLKNNKFFKLLSGGDTVSALKTCKDTSDIDNIKDSDTADVWVDTHTKLVHKVRFNDSSSPGGYFDIGQDYQGGNSVPFFIDTYSKSGGTTSNFHIGINLDMKANTLSLSGNFGQSGGSGETVNFSLKLEPNSSQVEVQKPAGAKTFIQLLNDLGLGDLFGGSGAATQGAQNPQNQTSPPSILN